MVEAFNTGKSGSAPGIGARIARIDQLGLAHGQLPQQPAYAMPQRAQPLEQFRLIIRQPQQVFGHPQPFAGAVGVRVDHAQQTYARR